MIIPFFLSSRVLLWPCQLMRRYGLGWRSPVCDPRIFYHRDGHSPATGSDAERTVSGPSHSWPSGKAMNGTDQIQFARHRCQLPANGRHGDKKSADHKRGSASQGRIYASTGTAIIKPLTKEKKELSLNGNCVFSLVSHSRGSPHLSAFICVYLRLTFLWDFSPGY